MFIFFFDQTLGFHPGNINLNNDLSIAKSITFSHFSSNEFNVVNVLNFEVSSISYLCVDEK